MALLAPEDRPYIEFDVLLNKGSRGRPDVLNEQGKVVRAGRDPEKLIQHKKYLVDQVTNNPYTWLEPSWLLHRLEEGWVPLSVGNMEKLPSDYPGAWRAILESAVKIVQGIITAREQAGASEAAFAAKIAEMQAQLDAKEALLKAQKEADEDEEGTTTPSGEEPGEGAKLPVTGSQKALGAAGKTTNAQRS